MPALRGETIGRAGVVEHMPDWLATQIERQRTGPWCAAEDCGQSMPQALVDLGYDTHPCCGPHDLPNPHAGQSISGRHGAVA